MTPTEDQPITWETVDMTEFGGTGFMARPSSCPRDPHPPFDWCRCEHFDDLSSAQAHVEAQGA